MPYKIKAFPFLLGFLFIMQYPVLGQVQKVADSLEKIYQKNELPDSAKLELLRNLSFNEVKDLKLSLRYAEELINLSTKLNNNLYLYRGYLQKGNKKRLLGNLDEALAAYFNSANAAQKAKFLKGEGTAYSAIADVYGFSNNHPTARIYYNKAIPLLRQVNDSITLASIILNSGEEFLKSKRYDSAYVNFKESGIIFEKVNYPVGKAYSLGNIGMVYANKGDNVLAEKNINTAIQILEEAKDFYPISVYLITLSDMYAKKGNNETALKYAKRSLQLAEQNELKEEISNANLKLSELSEKAGKYYESFQYYKNYITYRDSVKNINSVQKIAELRSDYEVSQKQTEVDLLNQEKRNQRNIMISLIIILGLAMVILSTLFWYYKVISREKKKSEKLLLNILPAETAKELKLHGKVDAIKIDLVTVLFTDFVEFSKTAENADPKQLVRSIDYYFKGFDEITTKYGLEKIKTIGDSYMCASGLPVPNTAHAINAIKAAKEMNALVIHSLKMQDGLQHFEIRIGLHTGPVVAGIVGIKKWQYDIWGDTVNIASRMESSSKPGRINLSETTYQEIKDAFPCEYRGEIEIKHGGVMKMYFLT